MANTSYTAAPSLVATNTTNKPTITTNTKLNITSPWLASGNAGQPDISTTLSATALEGASTLSIVSGENFPTSYPSVFQSGITYLPPSIGRLAGSVISGTNVIPFVADNELPTQAPTFVRLGSEILQVLSFGNVTVGATNYSCLNTATNTASAHPDFTPIHLNSLPTNTQYTSITVPHFYLADVSATGTMSGTSNTITTAALPATLGKGQTITTATGGTTYLPSGTTVVDYSTNSGLITLSNAFSTAAAGITFVNAANFTANMNPVMLSSIASVTSPAGGTHTIMSSLPNIGSVMTGTGMASPTYIAAIDTTNLRLQVSANPTSYGTTVALTSTLTFTCSTVSGSKILTIKNITVNGTSYPKVGSTNPTWNGRSLASYIKVGAPITTTTGGGIAAKYVTAINPSTGQVTISANATATVATATVTSAITMTANTGRSVNVVNNASSEINKIIAAGSSFSDTAGVTTYIAAGTTITKTLAVSSTQTELTMSAPSGTTGAWAGRVAQLSTTFTGTSSFSNQITGVVNASTLYQVGSAVYGNQYIPDNTTITGISGTTLTLSNALTNGFTTYTGQTFKVSSSLSIGKTYSSLPVTPLPCSIPVGTTLYLSFGNYVQNLTVTSLGSAGDTTLSVTAFQPRYNFSTTSYSYGVAVGLTGGYGYGASITTGLNADLYTGQVILLQANNSTDLTTPVTVKSYTRMTSRTIETMPFVSPYAYDGQSVGFSTTANFTGGSDQVTSVGSTGGLTIGQQVFSTCLPTTAQCFITAISGTTLTISTPATSGGTGATLSVYSNTFLASIPLTLDKGKVQEVVYPISLPTSNGSSWDISLASQTTYQHNNNASLVYYHWPTPIKTGDVTYRPDLGKLLMWDGFGWRTARVNSVSGVYSILGAVGGGEISDITLYDPTTNKETAADTYKGSPSTKYSTYHGGKRAVDPNGNEWTGATMSRIQFHLKVKVPQGKSVGFRSLALQSEYKAAPSVSSVHFTPGDNFEISPFYTGNSVFWYYSDLEKEPQTGWQVNIYDDYTYNRPDFDPDNAAIVPFWKASGADDTTDVEITGAHGWVNGERYWAFVRVAKQFHQKQWWGDWNSQRFIVSVDQPARPIMSIYTDSEKSVNKLAIQTTDNLLGFNNGTFVQGLGQWSRSVNDTVSSTVTDLNDGIPLGATLAAGNHITSLPVGATGFVIVQGALSGTGTGTFKVSASTAGGQDALGFPQSGRFWVTIGTEKILVENKNDGNKTGDTFTIITRGYKGTTAASHALNSAVYFGLQNDVYVGSVATIKFTQHNTVSWNTKSTATVRNYNGYGGSWENRTRTPLSILSQTQGAHKHSTDRVMVYDGAGLISHADVGSTVVLSFRHWHDANKKNVIGRDAQGNRTVKTVSVPDKVLTGGDVREVEMKIKAVQDIWDDTAHKAIKINIGATVNQIAGGPGDPTNHITIYPWLNKSQQFDFSTNQVCISRNYIPAGQKLTISSVGFRDPNAPHKNIPAASMSVYLTKDWHPTDKTLHIRAITKAPGCQVGNGQCFIIPKNSTISWQPPTIFTSRKVIHFDGSYRDKKGFEAQKLQPGDGLYVLKGRYFPGKANTATGTHQVTTVVPHTKRVDVDSTQAFVVDFLVQPTISTGGVLGTLTGSSFTIATGASTQYNAIAFSATPGSIAGAFASTPGLSPNSTVRAVTTVVGGTYAGYYAVTFNNSSLTQTTVKVQYTNVSGNAVSSPTYTGINATFSPSDILKISAGAQSLPVRPAIPNFAYQKYLPIKITYPPIYGDNVLAVDPTTGSGGSGDISEISLYPAGWSFTDQNPVRVNAGQTYGLSAYSKLVVGNGTPTFAPHIDWYDEVGSLLKSSYGTESLNNPGTINSVTIGVQMNTSASLWGQGWHPVAMVAKAPTVTLGTATFTSTSTSTGNFVIGAQAGFSAVNLKAGASLAGSNGTTYTLTTDVTATSSGFTLPVRFTAGITVPSSTVLTIKSTRAVPVLRWTNVNSTDAYGVSGVLLKALEAPSLGSNATSSTEMPKLTQPITVADNNVNNAFPIPSTTPIAGLNTLYVFDPVGDYGTYELHSGGTIDTLWTSSVGAVAIGTTQVTLNSVEGLAPGVALIFQYGGDNQETVYVDSSWAGGAIVPIAAPYFTRTHPKGSRVYSYTAGLASEVITTQATNTPVAVFNYGPDGYIASDKNTYYYTVQKSEDEGLTWTTLRHGDAVKSNDTGVAYITDYEAVAGVTTYYRAKATHYVPPDPSNPDYTVTGPPSVQLAANVITNSNWWLTSTSNTSLRFPLLVKTGYSETQRHPSGVFYPLGSSRPITTAGVPTGRDGSITVTWIDDSTFQDFLDLLNKGETLVLVNPVESDRKYIFINQDISITHNAAANPWREISINYVEAAPPGFGYTYGS